jgi:hypothetical protein
VQIHHETETSPSGASRPQDSNIDKRQRKEHMKAPNLIITCAGILVAAVASSGFALAALSCDDGGEPGDTIECRRYSDNVSLGQGQVNDNVPAVWWFGQGRDLTVFGFNSDGIYIDGCYAQVIRNVTSNPDYGPGCSQEVHTFTILGKDINTP